MNRMGTLSLLLLSVALAPACGDAGLGDVEGDVRAAELRGYDPDSLRWLVEGRTVPFAGVEWMPGGDPVFSPAVRRVGAFEGMGLYAPAEETPPYERLFFPLGEDHWQPLVPLGSEPASDGP